jgi:hypothetical protein
VRVARIERKLARIDSALDAYQRLTAIHGISIDGTPADFLARRAICGLLEAAGRNDELRQNVQALEKDFLAQPCRMNSARP